MFKTGSLSRVVDPQSVPEDQIISFPTLMDSIQFFSAWSKIPEERLQRASCIDLTDHSLDEEAATVIANCLRERPNIKILSLYGNPLKVEGVAKILEPLLDGTNQSLTALDIGHCSLDRSAAPLLAQLVSHNKIITHLSIRGNPITDDGVVIVCDAIAESNRCLRALDIGGIKYNIQGSKSVGKILAQVDSITTFVMNYNYALQPDSMRNVADGLAKNTSLITFDMSTTNSKGPGLVYVAEALRNHPRIVNLLMSSAHNQSEKDGQAACDAICELLKHTRTIEVFECFSNMLGDYGCRKLAEAIAVNKSLRVCRFCNNVATADGISAIANAMVFNNTLTHLDLMLHPLMGDGAAPALATMLAVNETLADLNLYECGLSTEGAVLLLQAAASNPAIQRVDLSSNEIDKDLVNSVVNALQTIGKKLQVSV